MPDTSAVISLMLCDLHAQVDLQLRHITDAQQHWSSSESGTKIVELAHVLACADKCLEANRTIRGMGIELRSALLRSAVILVAHQGRNRRGTGQSPA
jgi:hypothetical protein